MVGRFCSSFRGQVVRGHFCASPVIFHLCSNMDIFKLIELLATFLAGGGLFWLFNVRKHARKAERELEVEEFDAVSSVVERATQQIAELAQKVAALERAKMDMEAQLHSLQKENEHLKSENKNMTETLKRYFGQDKNLRKDEL